MREGFKKGLKWVAIIYVAQAALGIAAGVYVGVSYGHEAPAVFEQVRVALERGFR